MRTFGLLSSMLIMMTILPAQGISRIDSLSWLSGCWEGSFRDGNVVISEQWMHPGGGIMLMMSRTVIDGSARQFEFVRIEQTDDGSLAYIAHPSGQTEATFRLIELGDARVVFENLEHDYPQRISYRRISPDSLVGQIEGVRDGKLRGSSFPYRKVSCE